MFHRVRRIQRQCVWGAFVFWVAGAGPVSAGPVPEPPPPSAAEMKRLLAIITDQDRGAESKAHVIHSLAKYGTGARDAVAAIKPYLQSDSVPLRYAAIEFYAKVGGAGVPDLIAAIEQAPDNDRGKEKLIRALGGAGRDARDAVPLLVKLATNPTNNHWRLSVQALETLGHVQDPADKIVEACDTILRGTLLTNRWSYGYGFKADSVRIATRTLSALGPKAKSAVPMLTAILQSYADQQRTSEIWPGKVIEALQAIGPDAKEALPVLRLYLNTRDNGGRAEQAIQAIKSPNK